MIKLEENEAISVYKDKKNSLINVYLTGPIIEAHHYTRLFCLLYEKELPVNIYINSRGGNGDSAIQLCHSIFDSPCYITAIVCGAADSAASLIALSCDNLIVKAGTYLYFHNFHQKVDEQISGQELLRFVRNVDYSTRQIYLAFMCPFLDRDELDSLADDGEIYIHYDDPTLSDRIKRHLTHRHKSA
jgi:ATP-dependent protease ClpP protease subunit